MIKYQISEIKANSYYNDDIMLDNYFIIATPPCPITQEQLNALKEWNFKELISDGKISITKTAEKNNNLDTEKLKKTIKLGKTESVTLTDFLDEEEAESVTNHDEEIKENEDANKTIEVKHIDIEKPNTNYNLKNVSDENQHLEIARNVYNEYLKYITQVYTHYATHHELSLPDLSETILELCNFIRENKKYVLIIQAEQNKVSKNYIVSHSMRSTVFSIIIAQQLKMPVDKMVELGVTCMLHEIGQIRLPPQLYMSDRPLTPVEKAQMATHPIIGYNIVKEAGFPLSIQLGILEHHERETGTGYPRHLPHNGEEITLYAKIIAVACSFEAISAPRNFKEARTTSEAMIEMLRNENHQYDDTVIKALLLSVSLFPIGSYVYLSNGRVAQVIDISEISPKNPLVELVGIKDENGNPIQIQTDDNKIKIIRAMNKKEVDDVLEALKTQLKN